MMKIFKKALEAIYNKDGTFNRFESVDPATIRECTSKTKDRAYCQVIGGKIVQVFAEKELFVEW